MEVDNQSSPNVLANGALDWQCIEWEFGSVVPVLFAVVLRSARAGEGPGRAPGWNVHQLILPPLPTVLPSPRRVLNPHLVFAWFCCSSRPSEASLLLRFDINVEASTHFLNSGAG